MPHTPQPKKMTKKEEADVLEQLRAVVLSGEYLRHPESPKSNTVYYTSRWVDNGEPMKERKLTFPLWLALPLIGIGVLIGGLIW